MNKKIIKYIALSISLAVGIVTAFIGVSMGAADDYIRQLNLTNIDAIVPAHDVVSLNIDVDYADLEISASNDAKDFEISAENISRSYLKYSISNNILNLKYSFNKWYEVSSVPILLKKPGKIIITVPADTFLQDIQIKSGVSQTSINYLTADNIYIDCGMGNNLLNSINAEYIEINSGSGETSAENISSEKLCFSGGKGNTRIINFQTEKAEIRTGSGDVSILGGIKGDSVISCGMGDINAEFFGNIEDYLIKIPNGSAVVNGKEISETKDGKYKMDITTGMGDINISFK